MIQVRNPNKKFTAEAPRNKTLQYIQTRSLNRREGSVTPETNHPNMINCGGAPPDNRKSWEIDGKESHIDPSMNQEVR